MKTQVYLNSTGETADVIRRGGLAAVPTETVYGLAGNGLDAEAVEKIYEVKGRPAVKPLSLMVPSADAMSLYASSVPEAAYVLAEKFWPGPLTIVLPAGECIPSIVLAGGTTVGLRCPDHPLTLEALKQAGVPFAAPSANPSGEPSPKTAQEVLSYFDGKIDAVIDGGPRTLGTESTLISLCAKPYRILRQGALSADDIADALLEKMKIIGITGMTGSGKSACLEVLRPLGALTLDCDVIYHELLESSEIMKTELKERFPEACLGPVPDRRILRRIVFADADALKDLNVITHRYVKEEVLRRLREFAMEGGTIAAVDAVELLEGGIAQLCSLTVGVVASEKTRIKRIMERDGISREDALLRIRAQKPESYYVENCSVTIRNDGSLEEFRGKLLGSI